MKDYYAILKIEVSAEAEEIKTAFRKMALKYHPDRNKSADAVDQFNQIQKAYEVLSDPARRRIYDQKLDLSQHTGIPVQDIEVDPFLMSAPIEMTLGKQHVKLGEPFTLSFRCPSLVEQFKLGGLQHFEIVREARNNISISNRWVTEVHYVIKALREGVYDIGPATAIGSHRKFRSGRVRVKVQGEYRPPERSFLHKYYPIPLIMVIIGFPMLFLYNINKYGIKQPDGPGSYRTVPEAPLFYDQLETGTQPYAGQVLEQPVNEANFNHLLVTNKRKRDVVILLFNVNTRLVTRQVYIRGNDQYLIDAIPNGKYEIDILSGYNWSKTTAFDRYQLMGNFTFGPHFEVVGSSRINYLFWQTIEEGQLYYSSYTLTLKESKTDKRLTYFISKDSMHIKL